MPYARDDAAKRNRQPRGLNARHAVKQVDRMLSNPGLEVDQILAL
jgi:hypothetical protein